MWMGTSGSQIGRGHCKDLTDLAHQTLSLQIAEFLRVVVEKVNHVVVHAVFIYSFKVG